MRHFFMAMAMIGATLGSVAQAQDDKVVVELFTSQGCSSCPPADALLDELAGRNDVIALAFHVDYWDYLGWKDTFSSAKFTARQNGYAQAAHSRTVYTPQMVVGGSDHIIGSKTMEVMDQIARHRGADKVVGLSVMRNGDTLQIKAEARKAGLGAMTVQMVRYHPLEAVAIPRGENAGKTVRYVNIVKAWDTIGRWNGAGVFEMSEQVAGNAPAVVLIQRAGFGPIVAAYEVK